MDREQFRDGLGSCAPIRYVFFLSRQEEGEDGSVVGPASLAAGVIRALGIPDEMPTPIFFFEFLHTLLEYEKRTGRLLTNSEGGAWFWKKIFFFG